MYLLFALLTAPQLQYAAPPELVPIQRKLEAIAPQRFSEVAAAVGLKEDGPPIPVSLALESSPVARSTPRWVAGFATTPDEAIVLFPGRTPGYPNSSLEDVLRHEVAHILIARAAAQRPIPRWFNEGLAMSVERGWKFSDTTQFIYQWASTSRPSLDELDAMFDGDPAEVTRAYAMSGALVHDLMQHHGAHSGATILARMDTGASFDHAFTEVIGRTPAEADSDFWERQYTWSNWLPTLTSSTTIWLGITFLALLAIARRIWKNRIIERRWEEEERGKDSDTTIH